MEQGIFGGIFQIDFRCLTCPAQSPTLHGLCYENYCL
jgi:hypothetical protein